MNPGYPPEGFTIICPCVFEPFVMILLKMFEKCCLFVCVNDATIVFCTIILFLLTHLDAEAYQLKITTINSCRSCITPFLISSLSCDGPKCSLVPDNHVLWTLIKCSKKLSMQKNRYLICDKPKASLIKNR